jgi:hypothetical protein
MQIRELLFWPVIYIFNFLSGFKIKLDSIY